MIKEVVVTKETRDSTVGKDTSMSKGLITRIISITANPCITLGFALIIANYNDIRENLDILVAILASSFSPSVLIYFVSILSYKSSFLKYIDLTRQKRVYILFSFSISSIIASSLLSLEDFSKDTVQFFFILTILFGVSGFLTLFFTKVSIHSLSLAFLSTVVFHQNFILGLICLLMLPLVVWSRIALHKHTPLQLALGVIEGFLLGVFVVL